MIGVICFVLLLYTASVIFRPVFRYFRDEKGLRKYPTQNFLSGISSLAYGWEVGRKHKVFHTRRLHDDLMQKGVVRLGPNWLSFGSSRAVNDIYGYTSPCKKAAIYDSLQGGGQHLVNISEKSIHQGRRRMVAAAYAPKNTEMWEGPVVDSVVALLDQMDGMCTAPLPSGDGTPKKEDLKFEGMHWSNLFTFEAVIKVGLSKDMHFLDAGNDLVAINGPDGKEIKVSCVQSLHGGSRATSTLIWDTDLFPTLKKASILLSPWYKREWEKGANWRKIVEKLTAERIDRYENGDILDDLFQPMMEDKKGNEPDIVNRDRIAEVDQMINGGADGPGISLANTLYYLVKYPDKLAKLRQEVDEALDPSDKVAPWSKVKNLNYLKACVNESMRLSPPVATDLVRLTPPEGHKVDREMIPGNTIVSISAYTAHRDPDVYPDPESFTPERWLMKGDDRLKDMLAVYIPFSAGSRSCIGRNVTILFQLLFVATLIHRYDFALPSTDWEMEWEDYFNLWPKELPMKVWRRNMQAKA